MTTRQVSRLKPHPANVRIYGDKPDKKLLDSIKANGILNPLLVTWDNRVISGHRRLASALKLKLKEVPVVVFASRDEDEILLALIETNKQRQKKKIMLAREAFELAEIESRRALARQEASRFKSADPDPGQRPESVTVEAETSEETASEPVSIPVYQPGSTKEKVAEALGVSPVTAQNAIVVGREMSRLEESGTPEDQARAAALAQVVEERGLKPAAALVPKPSVNGSRGELQMVSARPTSGKAKFNRTNDKVSWANWTWNPVTGCLHDCPYCYARDIAERFYEQGFKPTFHPDRLSAPHNTRLPKNPSPADRRVFTCSMADLFGKWVPQEWIDAVFTEVKDNPQWEFLFLTKFPQRLAELSWPDNAWVGTTVDRQYRVDIAEKAFRGVQAGVKWLSCEPLLEPLKFSSLEMFDLVVIGGASQSTRTDEFWPPAEWVCDLWAQARASGCKIWMKPNTFSHLTKLTQEMPTKGGSDESPQGSPPAETALAL